VIAILAVVVGGWPMVALAVACGVLAMHEYSAATRSLRPLTIAGSAGVVGSWWSPTRAAWCGAWRR
jgi:hypothetical protein